jgi:hypothetical protein
VIVTGDRDPETLLDELRAGDDRLVEKLRDQRSDVSPGSNDRKMLAGVTRPARRGPV